MTDKLDRKLVYDTDEADNLLFAPKALVEETFALREVLPGCATWGDVRAALTDEQFARVSEGFIHPREFEAEKAVGGELDDWPVIYYHQIADEFIPESVLQQIGTEYSGALDSGWTLSAYDEDEIIQTLEENGFTCESRDDLGELFRL